MLTNKIIMKQYFFIILFFGIRILTFAQEIRPLPANLQALRPENIFPLNAENAFVFKDGNKKTNPSTFTGVKHSNGSVLFTAEIQVPTSSHYGIEAAFKSTKPVKRGDVLLARMNIRAVYAKQESGDAVTYFIMQNAIKPDTKSVMLEISVGPEWRTIDIPITADSDMDVAGFNFTLGALPQKLEITNIQVYNFGKLATIQQMPSTRLTYAGREDGAAWRREALERIEKIRTAPLVVEVVDAKGNPVNGANVMAKLKQSDFIWGTSVDEALLGDELPNSKKYREVLKELFNTAVIENGYKGATWQGRPDRRAQTQRAFEWLEQQGLRQRGHNLVWPGWKFNTREVRELAQQDTTAFRKYVENDIKGKIAATKGRVIAWDVVNEYLYEKDFFPYLPKNEVVKWFRMAKELDPSAQLFINEYSMLNSIASPKNINTYLDTIASLRSKGAPISGIGIQGHVGRQPRDPSLVIKDLDMFKSLGLPVQITEFDINMTDEELQADYTRDFLIACYSHPVVTGLTTWGFWQPKHWKPEAAMFRTDWTPRPSAAVWREWVNQKWKTQVDLLSGSDGKINARGHLGLYEVTVKKGGISKTVEYDLTKESSPVKIKL